MSSTEGLDTVSTVSMSSPQGLTTASTRGTSSKSTASTGASGRYRTPIYSVRVHFLQQVKARRFPQENVVDQTRVGVSAIHTAWK